MLRPQHQAEVGQDDQQEGVQELDLGVGAVGEEQARLNRTGDSQADGATERSAEHAARRDLAHARFERDDESGQDDRECDIGDEADRKRLQQGRRVRHGRHDQHTGEHEPSH